jgi:hypothetical protein
MFISKASLAANFILQLISPPSIQINQMPANVQVISIIINKLSKIMSIVISPLLLWPPFFVFFYHVRRDVGKWIFAFCLLFCLILESIDNTNIFQRFDVLIGQFRPLPYQYSLVSNRQYDIFQLYFKPLENISIIYTLKYKAK